MIRRNICKSIIRRHVAIVIRNSNKKLYSITKKLVIKNIIENVNSVTSPRKQATLQNMKIIVVQELINAPLVRILF